MGKKSFLTEITDDLSDKKVNFIVAGGIAVVLQGVEKICSMLKRFNQL